KEAPANNLEAFLGASRAPGGLDAPHGIPQPIERDSASLAAHLDIVCLRVRRSTCVGRGQTDNQEAAVSQLCRFCQRLREREVVLEAARRQIAGVVKLPGVGDPLIDQYKARTVLVEQLTELVAGAGRPLVVRLNLRECFLAAELPRKLAPQRSNHRAVCLRDGIPRRDLVADKHDTLRRREFVYPRIREQGMDAQQVTGGYAGEEVVQREHRMRFPAAEIRLKLDDGIPLLTGQPLNRTDEQVL